MSSHQFRSDNEDWTGISLACLLSQLILQLHIASTEKQALISVDQNRSVTHQILNRDYFQCQSQNFI